jgi:hypothetical protein
LWIADLHFVLDPMFFIGSAAIATALLLFSPKSRRQVARYPRSILVNGDQHRD